ncbi:membrane-spanning 4-domains subfamily A member 8-like [Elgaria multicarinata webbii]|uniref:membrane-spanning 4-domains subfamily A member 8-like n=1 Tax=Elgaria multicarinata webbii TaxID=159646 RepID=UPI002FCD46B5
MERNPVILANGTMFFIQPNGANTVQAGQVIPGMVQAVQYGGQQPGNPSNYPQQNRQVSEMEKLIMAETKTLGAIQIIIGLIIIGFGAVPIYLYGTTYFSLTGAMCYQLWAGLFFIASGSLSVTAEKSLKDIVVRYTYKCI